MSDAQISQKDFSSEDWLLLTKTHLKYKQLKNFLNFSSIIEIFEYTQPLFEFLGLVLFRPQIPPLPTFPHLLLTYFTVTFFVPHLN